MADQRVHHVAYIETDRSEAEVRETFSVCGDIRDIYPWKTGEHRASTHYFVEFEDEPSVRRARVLHAHSFKAHTVAYSPQMVAHFEGVSRHRASKSPHSSLPPRPRSEDTRTDLPSSSAKKSSSRKTKWSSSRPHQTHVRDLPPLRFPDLYSRNKENIAEAGPSFTAPSPSRPSELDSVQPPSYAHTPVKEARKLVHGTVPRPSSSSSRTPVKAEPGVVAIPATPRYTSSQQPFTHQLPSNQPRTPASSGPSPCVTLSYQGESLSCELDALSENPADVISALTKAAAHCSDRDKWMIVAGHYRGKRNLQAAVSVMTAMVDVMMSPAVGLTADELKPAFIMLASCHTDLSREVRRSGPEGAEAAREHMEKAKRYFQLVYGTHYPQEDPTRASPSATLQHRSLLQRVDRRPQDAVSPDHTARIRTMERELQSLRDKHTHQIGQLADAQAAKRKLEEDLDVERTLRQKAEREGSAELAAAQRSAKFALEQCRREVENRRRAEERVDALRDELAAVTGELTAKLREAQDKDYKARQCFARLGVLFTRAAQGELEDPTSSLFGGSSRSARATPVPSMSGNSSRQMRMTPPPMGPPAKRRRRTGSP